jgi:hypothetical protein
VFDSIEIGSYKSALVNHLGLPHEIINNYFIYHKNNLIAIFNIINEKIVWIKIGYYKNYIVDNIEKNIDNLVNYYDKITR